MAKDSLATGSIVLSTSADKALTGLKTFGTAATSWAGNLKGKMAGILGAGGGVFGSLGAAGGGFGMSIKGLAGQASGLLTGAGAAIGTMLGGPIGGALGAAVGGAVGSVGETVASAIAEPFERIDLFSGISKQAASLGISGSQFQGIQKQLEKVGIAGDGAGKILGKMGAKVADALGGNKGNIDLLASIGLSPEQLAGLSLDKQFMKIADGIASIKDPGQQAAAALRLFEEEGLKLLPALQKGGAGVQDFINQQKRFGAVLSDDQLAQAGKAASAWKGAKNTISAAWDGLANRATIIAAPIIEFAGRAVSKMFDRVAPLFDWVGRAVTKVGEVIGNVFDVLSGWFSDAVDWLGEMVSELGVFGDGWPTIEEAVVLAFKGIGVGAAYAWDIMKAGAGAAVLAFTHVVSGLLEVQKQLTSVVRLGEKLPGAAGRRCGRAAAWLNQNGSDGEAAIQKMREWGQGQLDDFGKSADRVIKWFDKPKEKPKAETGMGKVANFALQEERAGSPAFAAAAMRGSNAAYELEIKNKVGAGADAVTPAKQAVTEQKKTNVLLKDLIKAHEDAVDSGQDPLKVF